MNIKRLTLPTLLLLVLLSACTKASDVPSDTLPPDTPPVVTEEPLTTYQALCDMEALYIEADGDAVQEAQIEQLLKDLDAVIFLGSALNDPAERVAYNADDMTGRDVLFQWTLLQRTLSHFAPSDRITKAGGQIKVDSGIVETYWRDYFARTPEDALPPVPAELSSEITLQGSEYVIAPPDGVYPPVCLVLAYTVTDDASRDLLAVYADVLREDDLPVPVQVLLMKRADGRYVLLSCGLDQGEDDVFTDYTITRYQAVVSIPAECALLEQDDSSASFEASNGLTIRIAEKSFNGVFQDLYTSEIQGKPDRITDYMSDTGFDYGLVWEQEALVQYELVRMMGPGALVRVSVTIPREWAFDYFFLPEMLMESFGGAAMLTDTRLAIEEALLAE